jgi:HK97 family phage portal protein
VKSTKTRKPRTDKRMLANPPQWLYSALCGGGSTSAGVSVSESSALTLSAVWACVRVISETIGSLPWMTYRRSEDGGRERATDHEIYALLHDAPNPDMTAMVWKETTVAHCLLWGNAYSEIVRDKSEHVAALFPITPDRVTVRRRLDDGRLVYEVSNAHAAPSILQSDQVYHVPGLGFDGLMGYSVVHKARESMGLALATEKAGASFFGNGSRASGVLKHPKVLSDTGAKRLRESFNATYGGAANAGKTMILEEGMEWAATSIPNNDAQFLESRQFQIEEICRWFRVQPHKIQHLLHATFSNIEHQSIEFVTDTIRPWLVRLEQEANRKLLRPMEQGRVYTENLVDALLRGDALSRSQACEVQFRNGVLLGDEWRSIENRNPLGDGLGKRPLVTVNTVPLDRIDEQIDAKLKPAAPAAGGEGDSASNTVARHVAAVRAKLGDRAAEQESRRIARLIEANLEG